MPTLQDIRQAYPDYNNLSDQQLADALHSKFYSQMPQDQFYQKIGFTPQTTMQKVGSDIMSAINMTPAGQMAKIASPQNLVNAGVGTVNGVQQDLGALTGTSGQNALSALLPTAAPLLKIANSTTLPSGQPLINPASNAYGTGKLVGGLVGAAPVATGIEGAIPDAVGAMARNALTGAGTMAATTPGGVAPRAEAATEGGVLGGLGQPVVNALLHTRYIKTNNKEHVNKRDDQHFNANLQWNRIHS